MVGVPALTGGEPARPPGFSPFCPSRSMRISQGPSKKEMRNAVRIAIAERKVMYGRR